MGDWGDGVISNLLCAIYGNIHWWYDVFRRRRAPLIFKNNIQMTESYLVFIVQIMLDTGG
jgi:hypothetical protein